MSAFRFPFNWGSVSTGVASSTTTAASVPQGRWSTLANTSKAWAEGGALPRRFERIYTQPQSTFGLGINFQFKISSQFPFYVKADQQVLITSTITSP